MDTGWNIDFVAHQIPDSCLGPLLPFQPCIQRGTRQIQVLIAVAVNFSRLPGITRAGKGRYILLMLAWSEKPVKVMVVTFTADGGGVGPFEVEQIVCKCIWWRWCGVGSAIG